MRVNQAPWNEAEARLLNRLYDRPMQPEGYAVPDDDPDKQADLLAPVRARGRCYRPT